ncbi:BC85_0335 family putative methyltransferase [Candidatus Mycoplasma mahonii]|uniref:BC85_0335 family putative methyltransferase n=1 Tax=Candidatus Mycoplasma mahonii TaxID=3004105 RepID=UPI0026EA821B|nr:hypothetical protein [Candidatus Mycoplasma mahonii]WKX02312.1 hypothetical protein O3I44_02810 [Candidatus Mycoplasma mahonii]
MNNTVRWILIASIFVALIIMFCAWLWMKWKLKKIKSKYIGNNYDNVIDESIKNIEDRKDHGMMLWDLKEKTKKPLCDDQLEYIINTILRNSYKTTNVLNNDKYIKTSLMKLAKQKVDKNNPDTIIIDTSVYINEIFDENYKKLKQGGLIFIVNAHGKEIKKLLGYTKLTGIRRDYDKKIGKGIITIAK